MSWSGFQREFSFAVMASMVTCVGRASGGLLSSSCHSRSKCSASHWKAELLPSVSLSKNARRQQIGLGHGCCFAIAPGFGRRGPRLLSIRRGAGGAPGDDDEQAKRG